MINVEEIISFVENYYRLSPGSVKAYDKRKTTAKARKIAMALSRKYTDHSWSEIGDVFHRRHDTVLRGVRNVRIPLALEIGINTAIENHSYK